MNDIQVPVMGRQTFLLLRWLGYGSLLLFLLDVLVLAVPFKFTDAVWELNTYGQIIERIPLLLLAFPLIFFGEYSARMRWEKISTQIISWMTLVMAIFFFLGVPLVVVNTIRVQNIQQGEIIANTAKQNSPRQGIADRLVKAQTDADIRNILRALNPQQQALVAQIPNPEEVKKKLLGEITESISKTQSESEAIKRRASIALWKNSVKWLVAALVSAIFLFYAWKQSKWARVNISSYSNR